MGVTNRPGNATTDDLWAALGEVSGQNIKEFMVRTSRCEYAKTDSLGPLDSKNWIPRGYRC